jgi:uncharacterized protein YciI
MPERREQLYVFIARLNANPPPLQTTPEELDRRHHAWVQDLFDRKILLGSGPARDETGVRHAGAVVILRVDSLAAAQDVAQREPYCVAGQRTIEVIPWQRTRFEV